MKDLKSIGTTLFLISLLLFTTQTVKSQDNKTVNITSSGNGATQKEATQVALRSAIEQTFGVFISSKTEIFNDQIVADEYASISNGNIQSYQILNELKLTDGNWGVTLNATISLSKLINFVQTKGVSVEIQGGLFAINIKQQLLNEQAEIRAINQLIDVLKVPYRNTFDYSIKSSEPKSSYGGNNKFNVIFEVSAIPNKNMAACYDYLIKTLSAICLTNKEVSDYSKLNKKVYQILITNCDFKRVGDIKRYKYKLFNLRTETAFRTINNFFREDEHNINRSVRQFTVETGQKNIGGKNLRTIDLDKGKIGLIEKMIEDGKSSSYIHNILATNNKQGEGNLIFIDKSPIGLEYLHSEDGYSNFGTDVIGMICFPKIGQIAATFYFIQDYSLDEISKLKSFTVKPTTN
jgi:hypothetical protein